MLIPSLGVRALRPLITTGIALASLLSAFYLYLSPHKFVRPHVPGLASWPDQPPDQPPPQETAPATPFPLPEIYNLDDDQSDYCRVRFTTQYLTDLRDTSFEYCNASSASRMTCFHSHTHSNEDRDTLCIAKGAVRDQDGHFVAHCHIEQPDANATARGIIPFTSIRQYWYDTGARFLLENYMRFVPGVKTIAPSDVQTPKERRFTLLLKREGEGNLWHCMMEIWSMAMTIDVLRMSPDPEDNGRPFFRVPEDLANMQVVVLDDRVDGPYFDLWRLFSGRTPIRDYQISGNPEASAFFQDDSNVEHRVIVPLAGASNPMWHNDWQPSDCTHSETMQVFVHRVLEQYHIETPTLPPSPIRLTFVDRKDVGTRTLLHTEALLAAVKERFGALVEIEAVDFGALSFVEQLQVDRRTDILVGVHGAGLTHSMFMREHVTAMVELQPTDQENPYMGFRNLANMRGIGYFRTHTRPVPEKQEDEQNEETSTNEKRDEMDLAPALLTKRATWHWENFEIDESAFVEIVEMAIKSLYNKGMRNMNVL